LSQSSLLSTSLSLSLLSLLLDLCWWPCHTDYSVALTLFSLPDSFLSDRGPQFAAKAFRELLKLLGIESKLTTAYHPQGDGTTECFNQEIEAYLAIFCSSNPKT